MGTLGAIIGVLIGILGGALGTWVSLKTTRSPRERRFMVKMTTTLWVIVILTFGLITLLPKDWNWLPATGFIIALPFWILHTNKRQQQIRLQESNTETIET